MKSALERYYDGLGNVIIRDSNGYPGVFVRHPKQNSNEFDASLPNHVHPAFLVSGDTPDDAVLIGKYLNTSLNENGTLYSLPNAVPAMIEDATSGLTQMRSAGSGVSGMTIMDLGLLALMAQTHPEEWAATEGNVNGGCGGDINYPYHRTSGAVSAGAIQSYHGWLYECLKAHTRSAALRPDNAPGYWKKLKKVGGTPARLGYEGPHATYPLPDTGYSYICTNTLTGSGPVNWNFLCDPSLESDILGNGEHPLYGVLLNGCEINIMENNIAADPNTDLSLNSSAWKAILPGNNGAYTLVAPGTSGTLHLARINNRNTLVGRMPSDEERGGTAGLQKQDGLDVEGSSVPSVPSILYELGWVSLPGKTTPINFVFLINDNGKYILRLRKGTVNGARHELRLSRSAITEHQFSRSRAREIPAS